MDVVEVCASNASGLSPPSRVSTRTNDPPGPVRALAVESLVRDHALLRWEPPAILGNEKTKHQEEVTRKGR